MVAQEDLMKKINKINRLMKELEEYDKLKEEESKNVK